MDDALGLQYLKTHFDQYTRIVDSGVTIKCEDSEDARYDGPARCLIVDGHSSHIPWKVVQYALNNNIYMICLLSKSTHLLQPLDVRCFGVLQTTYKKNLIAWLRQNPLSAISKPCFLEILCKTRSEVYTTDCVTGAWRKSRCWPINRKFEDPADPSPIGSRNVLDKVPYQDKPNLRALDTPSRLQALTRKAEVMVRRLDAEDRDALYEVIDFAVQKVTKYMDIMPRADTLMKLRNGKVHNKRTKSKRVGGEARVLTYKHVNEGLQKLENEETERRKCQLLADTRKQAMEEKKAMQDILVAQWKVDMAVYNSTLLPG